MAKSDTDRNLVAALSYLLGFITGIVILLVEKEDRFIKFHALQSVLVSGGLVIFQIIVGLVLRPLGILATLVNSLIWLGIVIVWLVSMVKAYQGQMYKWPIAGDFAEKNIK